MTQLLIKSIIAALWSYMFVNQYTKAGEIFDFFPRLIQRLFMQGNIEPQNKIQYFIFKISYGCAKCHAIYAFATLYFLPFKSVFVFGCFVLSSFLSHVLTAKYQ